MGTHYHINRFKVWLFLSHPTKPFTVLFQENEIEFQENDIEFQENDIEFQENDIEFQENDIEFQENEIRNNRIYLITLINPNLVNFKE